MEQQVLLQRQAMKTQLHKKLIQPLAKVIQPLKVLLVLPEVMQVKQELILELLLMLNTLPTVWLINTVITHRFLLLPVLLHQQILLLVQRLLITMGKRITTSSYRKPAMSIMIRQHCWDC